MNITNEREDGEKMGSKNYTDVLIAGKIYTLGGLEEETYLQQVASYLNDKIAGLHRQDGFRKQPEDYQNVMTYLNIADDYFKEREHAGLLAVQKEELEKETYRLKHELVSTQMKLEAMRAELESIKRWKLWNIPAVKKRKKRSRPGSKAGKQRVHLQMKEADGNEIL